jgi:predicted dehydrogenase
MIQDGVIGKVKRVHAWSNKNWGYDGPAFVGEDPVPESLDWDLWLGTASKRPYKSKVYHPGQWRKLIDFGCGTLGDMGIHIFDTPYTALGLTEPLWVRTSCRQPTGVGHPEKNKVEYIFPETKYTNGKMRWTWYDGVDAPEAHKDLKLPDGVQLPGQGAMFIGEEGRFLLPHYTDPIVLDKTGVRSVQQPELEDISHYHQWVDACMGKGTCSTPFSMSGKLTEAMLLGVVANRYPGKKLKWDAENMQFTNLDAANNLLKSKYREGFGA